MPGLIKNSWTNKKWKYNFELRNYGFPYVEEIKSWVSEKPNDRLWGNMGFISCNSDEDAIMVVLKWS